MKLFSKKGRNFTWFKGRKDPRGFSTMINRIKVNHYNFNELLGRKDAKRCDCGAEKEDINHLLFRCDKYEEEKEYMYRKLDRTRKKTVLDVNRLIVAEE